MAPEPGYWARFMEALETAQRPLREDFEWLVGEYNRIRDRLAELESAEDGK